MKRGVDKEIPVIQFDDGWIGRKARDDGINRRHGWLSCFSLVVGGSVKLNLADT